jgi:hypothetical protein
MQISGRFRFRYWHALVVLAMLSSQVLLLAHAHDQDAAKAQYASCLTCIAAQNASPACPNALPEIDPETGQSPLYAEATETLCSAPLPSARQRSPPYPA